jgi:hypothetical protein
MKQYQGSKPGRVQERQLVQVEQQLGDLLIGLIEAGTELMAIA